MGQFIIKRLVYMVITIFAISIVSFILIQLPPGDFASNYVQNLQASGVNLTPEEEQTIRQRYGLGDPVYIQYTKWITNILFYNDWGRSFTFRLPVKEIIMERMALTVLLSLFATLLSWTISIVIGVYSATHQYSVIDYITNMLSFIGAGTPEFMLALIVMWVAFSRFGMSVGGLFSQEYAQAQWSAAKVKDLLQHLVIPVIVLAVGNTAWLMRTTRGNLLDELNKPYVETARAKGLTERRLLWKYPVRVALNPFFSVMGWYLAGLVSGSTLVAIVLNLDTTGPVLLNSLLSEDMYLAGSILLMLSILGVIGSLISDIILALVDPRIRMQG